MNKIKVVALLTEVMNELENCCTGGIGKDGPTLEELDTYTEEHGQPMEGDSVYHMAQRCYRLVEAAKKEL